MNAALILTAAEVGVVGCASMLGARALASAPRSPRAQLLALLAAGLICGAILGHQDYRYWLPRALWIDVGPAAWLLDLGQNVTPGVFMLICFIQFTDRRRVPAWLLALLAAQLGLQASRPLIGAAAPYGHLLTHTAPSLLQTLFAALALYWTVADWRVDMVEARRRIRSATLIAGAVLTLGSGLAAVLVQPGSRGEFIAHLVVTSCDLAVLAFVLFHVTGPGLTAYLEGASDGRTSEARARPQFDPAPVLARLRTLLEVEGVCGQEGLSLGALAERVGVPEYRLRKLIHEELGYRNFSVLLHDYRLREACRQLSDPVLRGTPILTIALSAGYASINTFSRGFREATGMTPSAWREAKLAEADAKPE